MSVPECARGQVKSDGEGERGEEDGGDENGIALEEGVVDRLYIN